MSDTKKDNLLSLYSEGRLKAQAKSDNIKADTGSEIMLQYALLRRGLALEMGNVLAFRLHRKWAEKLIEARMTVQSSTHAQVSFGQLMAADQRLFAELADRSREGIQSGPKGRPLDAIFEAVMTLPEVLHLMQPLPRGLGSSREVEPPPKPFRGGPYERPYSFWGVVSQLTRARPSASAMDSRHARRLSRTADASKDFMCAPSRSAAVRIQRSTARTMVVRSRSLDRRCHWQRAIALCHQEGARPPVLIALRVARRVRRWQAGPYPGNVLGLQFCQQSNFILPQSASGDSPSGCPRTLRNAGQ